MRELSKIPSAGATPGALDAQLDRALPAETVRAFLLAVGGERPGRVFPLTRNTVVIGRAEDAEVRVSDPSVSSVHARITNGSTGFEIHDLSSTNGTYVADQRIVRCPLKGGDRIRVGALEFTFLTEKREEATVVLASANAVMRPAPVPIRPVRPRREDDEPSIGELLLKIVAIWRLVRRNALVLGILAVLGAAAGGATLRFVPPVKAAACDVKLRPEVRSNPVDTEWRPPSADTIQYFAGAEKAFTSPELVRTTLGGLGERDADAARVAGVGSRLQFRTNGDEIYTARYEQARFAVDALDPVAFLSAHLKNYVDREIEKTLKALVGQAEFLKTQLVAVEKELAEIDGELVRFRARNADRLPEQAAQTHASRLQMETRRGELAAQIRRLEGELSAQSRFQSSQSYRDALATVNRRLAELRARKLGDEHPEVRQVVTERDSLARLIEQQSASEGSAGADSRMNPELNPARHQAALIGAQLGAARDELSSVERELSRARQVAGALPRIDANLQELTFRQQARQAVRAQLFDRLKKAELQIELERVSISSRYEMLAPPRLDEPGRGKTLALRIGLGLFAGLFLGAAIVALREARRYVRDMVANGAIPAR